MPSLQGVSDVAICIFRGQDIHYLSIFIDKVDYLDEKIVLETLWKNKNSILNSFLESVDSSSE